MSNNASQLQIEQSREQEMDKGRPPIVISPKTFPRDFQLYASLRAENQTIATDYSINYLLYRW